LSDALAERYDYPNTRALSRDETRALVNTDSFVEGFLDDDAGHLHPLNFALGLARAATRAGVQVFENSRVTGYTHTDPAVVRTARGKVNASYIVLGCNGYLGKLERRVAGKILPINNFMIATEPLGEERAKSVISKRIGVHDSRFVVNYFRMSEDHRLLFGGGENYRPSFPADVRNFVRPYMLKLFPQLGDARVDYAWGGTLSVTVNRLPHLGRLAPNLYFGQGFSGHGVSTAIFAGKIIAEAIAGTAERFDVFASLPIHAFPGGTLLRYPGMVLGMLFFSMKDKL
jgi:gamma-glutamylputrescine oxidase